MWLVKVAAKGLGVKEVSQKDRFPDAKAALANYVENVHKARVRLTLETDSFCEYRVIRNEDNVYIGVASIDWVK